MTGAFDHYPSDPSSIGRGYMILATGESSIGAFLDPASLAGVHRFSGIAMWGRLFGLKDLSNGCVGTSFPLKSYGVGIGLSSFGNSLYQESITSFSVGKTINEKMNAGIGLTGYGLNIRNYGSAFSLGINFSWRIRLNTNMSWGGALRNINNPTIGRAADPLPQVVVTGFSFHPQKGILSQIEFEQDTEYPGQLKFGVRYDISSWMKISGGYVSNPGQGTIGLSIHANTWNIYYGASAHPELGWTQWLGVGYSVR